MLLNQLEAQDTALLARAERAALVNSRLKAIALVAKLEAAVELSEERVVREHPEWQRLERRLLAALEPFPEASRAVVSALARPSSDPES